MAKRLPEQRLKTEVEYVDNGEIHRLIDTKTGEVKREEFRAADSAIAQPLSPTQTVKPSLDKPLLSAQEMLRLALIEREESFGRLVRELVNGILTECKNVILTGKLTYDAPKGTPAEIIKGAVAELKGLGYKVKKVANPEAKSGVSISVGWQTELKQPKIKAKPQRTLADQAYQDKDVLTGNPIVKEPEEGIVFTPMKVKEGFSGRPKKRFPNKKKEA